MKLRRNQPCPIPGHGFKCQCRTASSLRPRKYSKWETVRPGVRRIKDEHARHPDGYRYRLSRGEMNKVVVQKVREQNGLCSICDQPLTHMNDVVPDHREPRGMNGCWRDDRAENIGAAHSRCNLDKGSRRDL